MKMLRIRTDAVKRRFITLEEKLRVIQEIENNPRESRTRIAERLGLPVTTLKSIFRKKDEIRQYSAEVGPSGSRRSRSQSGMYAELEKVLYEWLQTRRDSNTTTSGAQLKQKALAIAKQLNIANDFKASSGWVDKFRKRHGIIGRIADAGLSVEETFRQWMDEQLPELISNYRRKDIYNIDETTLSHDLLSDRGSCSRQRLTVLVGVNADGSDKLPLLVVGREKNPSCFQGVPALPIEYVDHPKEWMTAELFQEQLQKLDARMKEENRHVLVLVDECDRHPKHIPLENIRLEYFPSNCTSHTQPTELGIVAAIKMHYRKLLTQQTMGSTGINDEDPSSEQPVNVLEFMSLLAAAWNDVRSDTIARCFNMAGITEACSQSDPPSEADPVPLPLHIEMKIEHDPEDLQESDRLPYEHLVRRDDGDNGSGYPSPSRTDPIKIEPIDEDASCEPGDAPRIPTFTEALQAYEIATRYIMSKTVSQRDSAVVAEFGQVLYKTYAMQSGNSAQNQ